MATAALLAGCCLAQPGEDALVLKEMLLQANTGVKLAMLDQFRDDFRKAEMIPWAYEEVCRALEAAGQIDRALAAGERLLAADPQSLEIAQQGLRLAEKTGDAALIAKWSGAAARIADCILASPDTAKGRMDVARSARVYADYLSYSAMVRMADPAAKKSALEDFLRLNGKSSYRTAVEDLYLETLREGGDARATLSAAKRILEQDGSNVVALIIVAEDYMLGQNDAKKLHTFATNILTLLDKQPNPEGISAAEWGKKKSLLAGRAHWMLGSASMQLDKFVEVDRSIRIALPYLKGNNSYTSAALFYLGWANYRLGKFSEAIRFNQQCMLVKGPFQEYAAKNLIAIRTETADNRR